MVSSAKLYSLAILFAMSVISGLVVPFILLKVLTRQCQSSSRFRRTVGLMNCFSGGVFIATGLLTLLPEARDKFEEALAILNSASKYPLTELLLGIGFILILLIESATFTFFKKRQRCGEDKNHVSARTELRITDCQPTDEPFADLHTANTDKVTTDQDSGSGYLASYQNGHASVLPFSNTNHSEEAGRQSEKRERKNDNVTPSDCINSSAFTDGMSDLHSLILILALSVHMLFDGLSVGLQDGDSQVWSVLMAMSLHKILIFLSTGITICESTTTLRFAMSMLFMSAISPVGVAVGIAVTSQDSNTSLTTASAVLQACAVGTFVYVAFFEILLKEFEGNEGDKILKAIFVVLGYALLAIVRYVMPEMEMSDPFTSMSHSYISHM